MKSSELHAALPRVRSSHLSDTSIALDLAMNDCKQNNRSSFAHEICYRPSTTTVVARHARLQDAWYAWCDVPIAGIPACREKESSTVCSVLIVRLVLWNRPDIAENAFFSVATALRTSDDSCILSYSVRFSTGIIHTPQRPGSW